MYGTWLVCGYLAGKRGVHLGGLVFFILVLIFIEFSICSSFIRNPPKGICRFTIALSSFLIFVTLVLASPFGLHDAHLTAFHRSKFKGVHPVDVEKWATGIFREYRNLQTGYDGFPSINTDGFPVEDISINARYWGEDVIQVTIQDVSNYFGFFVYSQPQEKYPEFSPMFFRRLSQRVFLFHAYRP